MTTTGLDAFVVWVDLELSPGVSTETWMVDLQEEGYEADVQMLARQIRSTLDTESYDLKTIREETEFVDDVSGFSRLFGAIEAKTRAIDRSAIQLIMGSLAMGPLESMTPDELHEYAEPDQINHIAEKFLSIRNPRLEGRCISLVVEPDTSLDPPWSFVFEMWIPSTGRRRGAHRMEVDVHDPLGLVLHRRWLDSP